MVTTESNATSSIARRRASMSRTDQNSAICEATLSAAARRSPSGSPISIRSAPTPGTGTDSRPPSN
jgi:hypothetical protein